MDEVHCECKVNKVQEYSPLNPRLTVLGKLAGMTPRFPHAPIRHLAISLDRFLFRQALAEERKARERCMLP